LYSVYRRLHPPWVGPLYGRTVSRHPRLANFVGLNEGWVVKKVGGGFVRLRKGRTELVLDRHHAGVMLAEVMAWTAWYLPRFNLAGKTVLDIGAGCGETAAFYFDHGAEKVVAVELDQVKAGFLAHPAD
jgi:2-polyprenyl-3-methyl-5-hydroxy-6-metoxy-1,4-benzoquinol methylase